MADGPAVLADLFTGVLDPGQVVVGDEINEDHRHDEALGAPQARPRAVVFPTSTADVAAILRVADAHRIPVTARGSGTGLSGAANPVDGGIVVCFERMRDILEIDTDNNTATVQPGVTLEQLDAALAPLGRVYPVFPGEYSASIGGNVNTNAGGMRAVKYGVTRHHVVGLEIVLPGGEVLRHGGKIVKSSTGYDLVQLVLGSEGTLALVTEVTVKLWPRLAHQATLLGAFRSLDEVTAAVREIIGSGLNPMILEYIDLLAMAAMTGAGLDLGIPDDVAAETFAYLVVMLEQRDDERLDGDLAEVGELLGALGAIDVYALPPGAAERLVDAREKAFWLAKAANADDIVDVVVPRASIAAFLEGVGSLAAEHGAMVAGCGHAGDGNVHLSVFQPDASRRSELMLALFTLGRDLGGQISGEHGLGRTKKQYFAALENPGKLALYRRIKAAFDRNGILNPGAMFDLEPKDANR